MAVTVATVRTAETSEPETVEGTGKSGYQHTARSQLRAGGWAHDVAT